MLFSMTIQAQYAWHIQSFHFSFNLFTTDSLQVTARLKLQCHKAHCTQGPSLLKKKTIKIYERAI